MADPLARISPTTLVTEDRVLALCEQGMSALVEARTLAEAKEVRDFASMLAQAVRLRDLNNESAIAASALAVRAQRSMGLFLAEAPKQHGARPIDKVAGQNGVTDEDPVAPTLADHGITKNESAACQRLAAVPEERFEEAVEEETKAAKERGVNNVSRTGVLRKLNPDAEKNPPERWRDGERFFRTAARLADEAEAAIASIRFGAYPGYDEEPARLLVRSAHDRLARAAEALHSVGRELRRKQ